MAKVAAGLCLAMAMPCVPACSTESRLRVAGETPYVRCLGAPPPKERAWQVGALRLAVSKRTLTVESPAPVKLAVFSGPAFGQVWSGTDLASVTASSAVAIVLGGMGETTADAKANLEALAKTGRVALVLGGGRDRFTVMQEAFDGLDARAANRVIDISALDELLIGAVSLVPVSGSELGQYTSADDACGFGKDDLDALAKRLDKHQHRWLVSWHAPAGPFARTDEGLELGSHALAAFARRVGVSAGLHAFPEAQAGRLLQASPRSAVVPRLAGARPERSDGSLVPPGFALVDLAAAAISWVPVGASVKPGATTGSAR
jgi:hypothetical protein